MKAFGGQQSIVRSGGNGSAVSNDEKGQTPITRRNRNQQPAGVAALSLSISSVASDESDNPTDVQAEFDQLQTEHGFLRKQRKVSAERLWAAIERLREFDAKHPDLRAPEALGINRHYLQKPAPAQTSAFANLYILALWEAQGGPAQAVNVDRSQSPTASERRSQNYIDKDNRQKFDKENPSHDICDEIHLKALSLYHRPAGKPEALPGINDPISQSDDSDNDVVRNMTTRNGNESDGSIPGSGSSSQASSQNSLYWPANYQIRPGMYNFTGGWGSARPDPGGAGAGSKANASISPSDHTETASTGSNKDEEPGQPSGSLNVPRHPRKRPPPVAIPGSPASTNSLPSLPSAGSQKNMVSQRSPATGANEAVEDAHGGDFDRLNNPGGYGNGTGKPWEYGFVGGAIAPIANDGGGPDSGPAAGHGHPADTMYNPNAAGNMSLTRSLSNGGDGNASHESRSRQGSGNSAAGGASPRSQGSSDIPETPIPNSPEAASGVATTHWSGHLGTIV